MLYLPPGVGHHGVALEDGLTFSIGFRAPSARELLAARLRRPEDELYRDPPLRPTRAPGEITQAALRHLRRLVTRSLDHGFEAAVGELVTEPSAESGPVARHPSSAAHIQMRLQDGAALVLRPGARLAYLRQGRSVLLFAEGRSFRLDRALAFAGPLLTRLLTGPPSLTAYDLRAPLRVRGFAALLGQVIATGALALRRHPAAEGRGRRPRGAPRPSGETPRATGSR
jgi:50S ribosomal protein L16 3-hydroxylase